VTHDDLFELGSSYDEMLQRGIGLAGETKDYFIEGRIARLRSILDSEVSEINSVVDFACGVGDTSVPLADAFGATEVVGVDVATGAVEEARRRVDDDRVRFALLDDLGDERQFDLCYVNGTYHHIPPDQRLSATRRIHDLLRPGGVFALFDNNPWSIPARLVMRRIPFDRDAVMLRTATARRILRTAGFETKVRVDYLFFFPNALGPLRRVEPALRRVPLGAQYLVVGRRRLST
jgi:SAM-dependent methyltransferase